MTDADASSAAQAIADRLVQQSSGEQFPADGAPAETPAAEEATETAVNNKRPRDDEVDGAEDEQEQLRKRASFTAPEGEVRTTAVLVLLTVGYALSRTAGSETSGS